MTSSSSKQPKAFVIMPFSEEFSDVYTDLIRTGLSDYEVTRADSRLDERNILEKIVQGIEGADLVVADLTTLNANVMYELGIAHALGKPTVMITQNVTELPFDVRSYPAHVYSTYFKRAGELTKRLHEIGERHREGQLEFGNPVNDFRTAQPPSVELVLRKKHERSGNAVRIDADEVWEISQRATDDLRSILESISSETYLLTGHLTQATGEINQARQLRSAFDRLANIRVATATHISAYAKGVHLQQPALHDAWRRLGESMLVIAQNYPATEADFASYQAAVADLDVQVTNALDLVVAFRATIANLPLAAPDMVDACDEAQIALDGVVNELMLGKAYLTRVRYLMEPDSAPSA